MVSGRIKAFLFDCDGVIADTMGDHAATWLKAFAEEGLPLEAAWVFESEGTPTRTLARSFLGRLGAIRGDERAEKIGQSKERHFARNHRPRIYPGIGDILSLIERRGLPFALVSGGTKMSLERSLPPMLVRRFRILVSADDVTEGKPSPEPYLKAANLLAVEPRHCLVIENAPMGIRAAKAAGMRCIALCTTLPAARLSGADATAKDHAELMAMLEEWLALEG